MIDWLERNRKLIDYFRANEGKSPSGSHLVLLTTTGNKTGRTLTSPLVYLADGDGRYVVFGSVSGAPNNPGWYHNIKADPRVTVEVGADKFECRAVIATGSERERLWARAVEAMPLVKEHQAKTTRQFPIVILEKPH